MLRYDIRTGVKKIKTKTALTISGAGLATAGLVMATVMPLAAKAATVTTTVTPSNFNTIFTKHDVRPTSSNNFVVGPSTPPAGIGSLELTTSDGTAKQQHLEEQQLGASLSSVDALSYSTYRQSDSTGQTFQVPSINMEITTDGTAAGYTSLVFEPVYQSGGAAAIQNDQWQTWNAYGNNAIWWSTHSIPGICAFTCYVSWSDIVAANPGAVILSYGVNQGSGNPGIHANVDALTIGLNGNTTVYDFEPYAVASDKDACKNGGWAGLSDAAGHSFKNQGDCVSYVATGGKNKANG